VQKYAIETSADLMSSNSGLKPIAAKRLQAAKLLERGWPVDSVAETVGMNVRTVKEYKAMLDAGGIERIERISVGGRKSVLDDKARAWIVRTVKGSPRLHGFETDRWSNPKLLTVIEREFGLRFSDVYIRKLTIDLGLLDRMQPHKAPSRRAPGTIDAAALAWIASALRQSPREQGIDADHWSNGRLRAAIETKFGVRYSRFYIWHLATGLGLSHVLINMRK
jgi:transposase